MLLIKDSYCNFTNKTLPIEWGENLVASFSRCPYPIASHDTNSLFNYANDAALNIFKTNWNDMIGKHSSLSADSQEQDERNNLLAKVATLGFFDGYKGKRKAFDGSFFHIYNATVWNIVDGANNYHGQAVIILEHS